MSASVQGLPNQLLADPSATITLLLAQVIWIYFFFLKTKALFINAD